MKNKPILLKYNRENSWEGLYVNGELVAEGNPINGGFPRISYFFKLAEVHHFDLADLAEVDMSEEDCLCVEDTGDFETDIKKYKTKYGSEG